MKYKRKRKKPLNCILIGDVLKQIKQIPDNYINCVVTSPPYYGLRDYGVDGQIGLEQTPDEYVQKMVEVFREVKRVLRDDGVCWLNLGDSYAGGGGVSPDSPSYATSKQSTQKGSIKGGIKPQGVIKQKDLIGIPWMVAFDLRADGWYLRQDIIWHKPNPMPESVTDRCTKAHEYVFLLTNSARYWYDAEAIREGNANPGRTNYAPGKEAYKPGNVHDDSGRTRRNDGFQAYAEGKICNGRNKRSVWTVSTTPYKNAHFATFPPKLIEPMILAGCPEGGIVLDPFFGAGTTGIVSKYLGRNYIGIELNPEYSKMAQKRINKVINHQAFKLF